MNHGEDQHEDEILSTNIEDISQIFYSDFFQDNDENNINPIFNPSRSPSPLSCIEDPVISSWISGIEEKLFNEEPQAINKVDDGDEEGNGNGNGKVFCPDDFFADLDLPFNNQSHEVIRDSSCNFDNGVIRALNDENCSTPESHLEIVAGDVPAVDDDYFSDYLFDVLTDQSEEEEVRVLNHENSSTPESPISLNSNNQNQAAIIEEIEIEKKRTASSSNSNSEEKDDDDPITKKRKRQMRNRDAAVRSRERKKMHMKDLEMKSKYLEGECMRLQRILQCCVAENHTLRLQLQEKAFSATMNKQESAVLFMESLLLGSLLWFLVTLGLEIPLPSPSNSAVVVRVSRDNRRRVALGKTQSESSIGRGLCFKSRRCKASRSRMKTSLLTYSCYGASFA